MKISFYPHLSLKSRFVSPWSWLDEWESGVGELVPHDMWCLVLQKFHFGKAYKTLKNHMRRTTVWSWKMQKKIVGTTFLFTSMASEKITSQLFPPFWEPPKKKTRLGAIGALTPLGAHANFPSDPNDGDPSSRRCSAGWTKPQGSWKLSSPEVNTLKVEWLPHPKEVTGGGGRIPRFFIQLTGCENSWRMNRKFCRKRFLAKWDLEGPQNDGFDICLACALLQYLFKISGHSWKKSVESLTIRKKSQTNPSAISVPCHILIAVLTRAHVPMLAYALEHSVLGHHQ